MVLDNVCRLCRLTASSDTEYISLFENGLNDKLKLSCLIFIEQNDHLPSKVCPLCKTMIEQAVFFKKRCEETNTYFDEYLNKKKNLALVPKQRIMLSVSSPQRTSRHGSPKIVRDLIRTETIKTELVEEPKKVVPIQHNKKDHEETENVPENQQSIIRHVSRQYTRRPKNIQPIQGNSEHGSKNSSKIVLFDTNFSTESPVKIKQEPQVLAEVLNDWDDSPPSPSSSESTSNHRENTGEVTTPKSLKVKRDLYYKTNLDLNEWDDDDDDTKLKIKNEPFNHTINFNPDEYEDEEIEDTVKSPNKRLVGEELVVENHCNMVAVYNGSANKRRNSDAYVQKVVLKNQIKFHCTECSTGFTSEVNLMNHNCGNLRYACYICKAIYKNEYALVKHMAEHQTGNGNKAFNNRDNFKEETNENVYSSGNFIRMESTHKRQKTMFFKDN